MLALTAPFLLALAQRVLIPSWYDVSLYVGDMLLLCHVLVVVAMIAQVVRKRTWTWPARAAATVAILLVAAGAVLSNWDGSTREGVFLCGRELQETVTCSSGAQAFAFVSMCIAGNPKNEVEVRPNALPFMYPVAEQSAAAACAGLSE